MNNIWTAALQGLIQAAQAPLPEMKPGMKTSEFALSSAGAILIPTAMQVGAVSPTAGAISAALIAIYTLGRSFMKASHADATGTAAAAIAANQPAPAAPAQ